MTKIAWLSRQKTSCESTLIKWALESWIDTNTTAGLLSSLKSLCNWCSAPSRQRTVWPNSSMLDRWSCLAQVHWPLYFFVFSVGMSSQLPTRNIDALVSLWPAWQRCTWVTSLRSPCVLWKSGVRKAPSIRITFERYESRGRTVFDLAIVHLVKRITCRVFIFFNRVRHTGVWRAKVSYSSCKREFDDELTHERENSFHFSYVMREYFTLYKAKQMRHLFQNVFAP